MLIDRYSDGGLLFNVRWSVFIAEWRTASDKERVVLSDGRPAIRREPSPLEIDDEVTYTTLPPALWEQIKTRQKEAFRLAPPPPRTRLCQACRSEMRVAREYEDCWTFKCDRCTSSEVWGKDVLGGTRGAGEVEKK